MDFLSDNFAFAIFIVIAIVLQIGRLFIKGAERRRREERGERAETPAKELPEAAAYGADKYENGNEDDGGAFSAWNLSVDDETSSAFPASPHPASPHPVAAPRPVSVSFPAPVSGSFPFPALLADSAPGAESREPGRPLFPSVPEAGSPSKDRRGGRSGGRSKGRTKRAAGFPEKLDYLPPLKRAVVLAEILGTPRGF
ncbi:MAG: hypothetical protein LBB83_03255 [Treponema sp.]|jgi:hypothetical protein|nr:hypothetical protein [Treponema sp.]